MNSTVCSLPIATPDSANVERMLNGLVPQLQDIVQRFRQGTPTPEMVFAFETELETCCRAGCRTLVEAEYNGIEPAAITDCPVRLRLADEEYKRRPKSPNTIGTLFGLIRLARYRYEALERGVRGIFPLEMQLGIEAGLATPALAERIGLQSADHTQQQVLDWLERDHGVKWSAASLRKLSASLSEGLSAFRQPAQEKKLLELLKKAEQSTGSHQPVLAVGRDGIMVPMRHGACRCQEASTATVYVLDRRGKRLGTVYLGQMPESGQGELSHQLTSLLIGVLTKWDGCLLRYVYVTDAGHHPQEYYKTVLQKMEDPRRPGRLLEWQWIVDFWHACCYLTKLREGLFGETGAGWKWFKRMRHWLRHRQHGITDVLRSATQYWNLAKDLDAARKKLFWDGYDYLRKYARRMAYARYQCQGKPIGSGVTEAACKIVFTQRLKQSGMTWEVNGGQVIVDLRVLKLSGVWREAFRSYQRSRPLPQSNQPGSRIGHTPEKLKKAA
jgi:hypothetical protein